MEALKIIDERVVLEKEFRIFGTPDEPLFLARDVAEWIDYAYKDSRKVNRDVSKMLLLIDNEEKQKNTICLGGEDSSHGGVRENTEMWFLTEDGLYEVLMQSRKPIAKQFKKKVKEILRSIRTNGGYIVGQETLSDDELLAKALVVAQNKIAEKDKKLRLLESETIEMSKTIAQMQPKVNYVDIVLNSRETVCVTQIAQDYGMSANRFNKILKNLGIQRKVGNQWILYAKYLSEGYVQSETWEQIR